MSSGPKSQAAQRRERLLRRIGMIASGLMVLLVVIIFTLALRSESAHDESVCQFTKLGERALAGLLVIEESRSCVPEAEEHRWLLQRAEGPAIELGRKRLPKPRFTTERTQWRATQDEQKRVLLNIVVDGRPFSEFREADLSRE